MILLLGGTGETAPIAWALASQGFKVLVSTATDFPLRLDMHDNISVRTGVLDGYAMARLVEDKGIRVILDATHPYARVVSSIASRVARELGVACITWVRPLAVPDDPFVSIAADHEEAARMACGFGRPVLLTTGSRNLAPYVREARGQGVRLVARVLATPESVDACLAAGIEPDNIVTGIGPFSLEDNLSVIRRHEIGCLVTKDSGAAGGVPAKIEAAQLEGCRVVMVQRPGTPAEGHFSDMDRLMEAVRQAYTDTHGDGHHNERQKKLRLAAAPKRHKA